MQIKLKKSLILLVLNVVWANLFFASITYAQTIRTLNPGVSTTIFSATASVTSGTTWATPSGGDAIILSYVTDYTTAPGSITLCIQGSNNNIAWFDLSCSSSTADNGANIGPTAIKFVRVNISAVSGGTATAVTIVVQRFNSPAVFTGGTINSDITMTNGGRVLLDDGTGVAPSLAFRTSPTWGISKNSGYGFAIGVGGQVIAIDSNSLVLGSSTNLGWITTALSSLGPIDARFRRTATKTLTFDDGAAGEATLAITGKVTVPKDCLAGNVHYSFTGDTDTGLCAPETKQLEMIIDGVPQVNIQDQSTSRPMVTIMKDVVDGDNFEALQFAGGATGFVIGTNNAGTGTLEPLTLRGNMGSATGWTITTSNHLLTETDGAVDIGQFPNRPRNVQITGSIFPAGPSITPAQPAGTTLQNAGEMREVVYKILVDRTAFVCAATTCDVTVGTLPAKTQITGVMADLTTTFACTATCTSSTLSMQFGRGAGGTQWLASFDADAAIAQFGDADAELGTTMTRAAAIQGGSFESWTATQAAVIRLTSGTGNIGNGSVTNLSQGSVTVYLTTRILP